MSNLTMKNSSNYCFTNVDSRNVFKEASVGFVLTSGLVIVSALCFIIWFEKFGSDKKRTLINKLASAFCWNGIVWCLVVQSFYTARFLFGPLAPRLCFWIVLLRKCVTVNIGMTMNAITATRYVFIFWLKNPAAFNDDFWCVFANVWVVLFSFVSQFPRVMAPGRQLVEVDLCSGQDPTTNSSLPGFGHSYVAILGVVLHVYVYVRIGLYKLKKKNVIGPLSRSRHLKNLLLADLEKNSIVSFAGSVLFTLVFASNVGLVGSSPFRSCSDFLLSPKIYFLYYIYLVHPNLSLLIILTVHYHKNELLKGNLFRQIRSTSKNVSVVIQKLFRAQPE